MGCTKATMPKTNASFWQLKFEANVARDARVAGALRADGYRVLTIWECEMMTPAQVSALRGRLARLSSRTFK
jgi:DNA mismatch endonuclease (patch repair protein)